MFYHIFHIYTLNILESAIFFVKKKNQKPQTNRKKDNKNKSQVYILSKNSIYKFPVVYIFQKHTRISILPQEIIITKKKHETFPS